jgi:hypothetical protein
MERQEFNNQTAIYPLLEITIQMARHGDAIP